MMQQKCRTAGVPGLALMVAAACCARAGAESATSRPASVGPDCPYRLEQPGTQYRDVVTLSSGAKVVGKALEWGTVVRVFDAGGGVMEYPAGEVRSIELRRDVKWMARGGQPDLTVALVERETGGKWLVHVLNAGGATAGPFGGRWSIGGAAGGRYECKDSLDAGQLHVIPIVVPPGVSGNGELRVEIDGGSEGGEAARWNNTYVEPFDAFGLTFTVSRGHYEAVAGARNLVDTFCFEDWLQYHVRVFNALLAASVHPAAPDGVRGRVRVARLQVTDDGPATTRPAAWPPMRTGASASEVVVEIPGIPERQDAALFAARVDWRLVHRIGLALGLVDLAAFDSPVVQCLVRGKDQNYLQRAYRAPWHDSLMHGGRPFGLTEFEAVYLNRLGHEWGGSRGAYLHGQPRTCSLRILDGAGRGARGVDVSVYQRGVHSSGAWVIPNEPVYIGKTDDEGRFALPARPAESRTLPGGYSAGPNPWGEIAADGSNGLFLVRIGGGAEDEFAYVSILEFSAAYARGEREAYERVIRTRLGGSGAPASPQHTLLTFNTADPRDDHLHVYWRSTTGRNLLEYRLYAIPGRSAEPWTLVDVRNPQPREGSEWVTQRVAVAPLEHPAYAEGRAMGTHFAVSAVDAEGREGPLAPSVFAPLPGLENMKLAVDRSGSAYFSVQGPGGSAIIRSNLASIHLDWGLRTTDFPGYEPWFAGLAFDLSDRLIVTDNRNHCVGWYEQGNLVRLVGGASPGSGRPGRQPGEFNAPADVAVDDRGRVYVADTGNHRVQEFDADGKFVRNFQEEGADPEGMFDGPSALGAASGRLCVTDKHGERIQIFDVTGEHPKLVRVLRNLTGADRGLVGESGRVYVLAKNERGKWAALVFPIEPLPGAEKPERTHENVVQGWLRDPRGLYADSTGHGLFVTSYPFVVMRVKLE